MKSISVETLREKLSNQELIYIIDLRDASEFRQGHIEESENRPLRVLKPLDIKRHFQEDYLGDTPIVLYGEKENRACKAYKLLESAGLKNIYYLEGGFTAWSKWEEVDVITTESQAFLQELNQSKSMKKDKAEIIALILVLLTSIISMFTHPLVGIIPVSITTYLLYKAFA